MKYGKIAIVAAGCLLAIPTVAVIRAQAHGEAGGFRGHPMRQGYLGFLAGVQLTDAQRQQMHEIMKSAWSQNKAQFQQLRALRGQIADQMASTAAVSADAMDTLHQQAAQIGEQLDGERLAVAVQVRGLLTPEQLSQSASVHTQLKALHQQERALLMQDRPSAN